MSRDSLRVRPILIWCVPAALLGLVACGDASRDDTQDTGGTEIDAGGDGGGSDIVAPDAGEPRCGDGIVDEFESCDDGNEVSEAACPWGTPFCSACAADCSESLFLEGNTCGDGERDPDAEVCDRDDLGGATCAELVPGSLDGTPRCAFDCQSFETGGCRTARCGDGVIEGGEVCDDGNAVSEGACAAGVPTCVACNADCSATLDLVGPFCGDGTRDPGEVCDDGNAVTEESCPAGEARCEVCNADCTDLVSRSAVVCGNGLVEADEVCDRGVEPLPESCPWGQATCSVCNSECTGEVPLTGPVCGDGVLDAEFESCDGAALGGATCASVSPRFVGGTLGCTSDCDGFSTVACEGDPCGNGAVEEGEVCDDGNADSETTCAWGEATCTRCNADCTAELSLTGPFCGDGIVDAREVCDAGEEAPAERCAYGVPTCDVCRSTCDGFDTRVGPYCGDDVVDSVELCDDGTENGAPGTCSPVGCSAVVTSLTRPAEYPGDDTWGWSVALNDRWLVVGQPFEEVATRANGGAIYVFVRNSMGFSFSQRIASPSGSAFSLFGRYLHVVGDEILTSCTACADENGALLSYRFDGSSWALSQSLSPPGVRRSSAGNVAAFGDDAAVLVSPFFSIGDAIGIPWLFERGVDGTWAYSGTLLARDPLFYAGCGVSVQGDTIFVGSCDYNGLRGAWLEFRRLADGSWVEGQMLVPGAVPGAYPAAAQVWFGETLAFVSDDLVVAGMKGLLREDGTGWLLAFERRDGTWVQIDSPQVDETGTPEGVGWALASTGNRLAVSYNRLVDGVRLPEVTFFERRDGAWVTLGRVRHSVSTVYASSETLAGWEGRFVVGSPWSDIAGRNAGTVWLY